MNKEQLIAYYHRFCRWQHEVPRYVNRHEGEVRHCHNCGTEFSDNFCPRCGQRAEVSRVGWRSIRESITLLWGLDSRSLGYTLVQLLGRPGYLVRDYISGHRQVSFPPVKMLVLVCLSVVIFESVFHQENNVISMHFKDEKIDSVMAWINAQKSWATLLYQSLYILPTWLVFRFAPGYPRHTLPEGFFLQVFLSVQSLLLSFLGYWNSDIELWLWLIYMYITYRQLFGYGWWSTLWRFVVVMLLHLGVMATVAASVTVLLLHRDHGSYVYFVVLVSAIVLLTAVMLIVTHRINKRTVNQER